jgi:predicted DNA-binding transcriptional regulator YafY
MNTPARLLTLLSLLQTPREWPGTELAERLDVSPRTIRRDIDRLRELGYPVEATMGAAGGYRLVAGKAMPPLLLEDDEAVAIAVGLRTAAREPVSGIEEASVRALAKVEQVLPARLRHRLRSLGAATVPMLASGPAVAPEDLTVLAAAIANSERLRFAYKDAKRLVEPRRLVVAGRRWYLLAFDNDRDDWRLFRVDRIRSPQPTGARITARELPAGDAEYVTSRLYSLVPTYEADVTLHAAAADLAQLGGIEPLGENSCRWRSAADTLDWLAFRLLQLGCEFEVHGPVELVEHLRALHGRLGRGAAPKTEVLR